MSDYPGYANYWDDAATRHGAPAAAGWWNGADPDVTLPAVLDALAPPACDRLYDVGCGSGALVPHVRARWPDAIYVGVDVSQHMIDAFDHNHAAAPNTFSYLITGPWLPSAPADYIVFHQVTMHISEADCRAWLRLIRSRLKTGGRMSVSIYYNCATASYGGSIRRTDYNPAHFEAMLAEAGYRVTGVYDGTRGPAAWGPDAQRYYGCTVATESGGNHEQDD